MFEPGDRLREIPLMAGKQAKTVLCHDHAGEVPGRVGNPGRLLAVGEAFGKRPQFGTAPQQPEPVARRGSHHAAEAGMAPLTFVGLDSLPEHVGGAMILP
jgi:hypothetical protein